MIDKDILGSFHKKVRVKNAINVKIGNTVRKMAQSLSAALRFENTLFVTLPRYLL